MHCPSPAWQAAPQPLTGWFPGAPETKAGGETASYRAQTGSVHQTMQNAPKPKTTTETGLTIPRRTRTQRIQRYPSIPISNPLQRYRTSSSGVASIALTRRTEKLQYFLRGSLRDTAASGSRGVVTATGGPGSLLSQPLEAQEAWQLGSLFWRGKRRGI